MNNTILAIILISILLFFLGIAVKDILCTTNKLVSDLHYYNKRLQRIESKLFPIYGRFSTSKTILDTSTQVPDTKSNIIIMD